MSNIHPFRVAKSDEEWRRILSPEAYRVLRQRGTEPPFTNAYYHFAAEGIYVCGACGASLFSSSSKYESGSGWPSFTEPLTAHALHEDIDLRFGMTRREINCANCGGHIGHVFTDGPKPLGLRYCTNSAALVFTPLSTITFGMG